MDTKEILKEIGLDEKECSAYLAALELGTTSATAIASKAGIQRTHFYDIAKKLVARGFLKKSIKGKRVLFSALDPSELLKKQEEKIEKLGEALPELKALYNTSGQKPRVYSFEGKSGIDQINEDTLQYKGEMVGFTTPRFVAGKTKGTGAEFIKKRVSHKKHSRVIGEDAPEIHGLKARDQKELRETRILAKSQFHSDIEIVLYGNRIACVDYKEEWGLIIESAEISSVMKMIFELIWSRWDR